MFLWLSTVLSADTGLSGMSDAGSGGGGAPPLTPSLDFSDSRNSQYLAII